MLLKKVRLSYPSLFSPSDFKGDKNMKFRAVLIIEKDSANHKMVQKAIDDLLAKEYKGIRLSSDKLCLKDGDDLGGDENEGHMVLRTSSVRRVPVVDRDKTPLTEEDEKPYAGCYVNASVDVYPQKGQWGNRINGSLRGIQFDSDGDRFTGASVAGDDEFVDYEEEVSF
jgi:hypothetical protein